MLCRNQVLTNAYVFGMLAICRQRDTLGEAQNVGAAEPALQEVSHVCIMFRVALQGCTMFRKPQ
jgi:hypothetical protein